MKKVLFICHGNICRSPVAEFVFKNMVREAGLSDAFLIESAATSREELGNDIYPPAKRSMDAHGIPYESREARQITKSEARLNRPRRQMNVVSAKSTRRRESNSIHIIFMV